MSGYTPGPWFVAADSAEDCPDHANSGLAMVETGREGDWPIARLCEWPNAKAIARLPEMVVEYDRTRDDNLNLRKRNTELIVSNLVLRKALELVLEVEGNLPPRTSRIVREALEKFKAI